jgi:hypothetical protein
MKGPWVKAILAGLGLVGASIFNARAAEPANPLLYEMTTETLMPNLEENLRYAVRKEQRCMNRKDLSKVFWMLDEVAPAGLRPGEVDRRRRLGAVSLEVQWRPRHHRRRPMEAGAARHHGNAQGPARWQKYDLLSANHGQACRSLLLTRGRRSGPCATDRMRGYRTHAGQAQVDPIERPHRLAHRSGALLRRALGASPPQFRAFGHTTARCCGAASAQRKKLF